jgi:hypothetical protein
MRTATCLAVLTLGFAGAAGLVPQAQSPASQTTYEFRYHNYEESTALLQQWAARFPRLARVYSIGRSATGLREIWCIEIGNQAAGDAAGKPAVYFDGNQHAAEVMGGEVTLHLAHYLLSRYGSDPDVTRLVDTRVVYVVQRADPDGAEAFMAGKVDWDPATAPGARDADGDGRKGEDGPEDVDGDGEILSLRVADPNGRWKASSRDARLLVPREEADREGPFYRLEQEGLDNDGDGRLNEDPPVASFISNRNYPAFWASDDGRFRGAGDYPLQEHNARLLVDFIVSRRHISQVESFHTTSGIHLRPYAARPDSAFPPQDLQDFSAVLAKGTAITTYPVASVYNDFTDIVPGVPPDEQPDVRHGVFIDWAYVHEGLFALTTELWTMEPFVNEIGWGAIPRDKPLFAIPGRYSRPDVQASVLAWLDRHKGDAALGGQGFREWTSMAHPTLGRVEIGGFSKYWLRNPPPGPFFERISVDQARFAVVQALTTPLVRIEHAEVRPGAAAGEFTIDVRVVNTGYLDTATEQARRIGKARPVTVTLTAGPGVTVAAPAPVSFPFLRGTRGSDFTSRYFASWTVRGPRGAKVVVEVRSEKGGTDRRELTL